MTTGTPETHLEYAQRIGPPRDVPCEVDLLGRGGFVFICQTHDYRYNDRGFALDGLNDRCPMSRLEAWRARRWDRVDRGYIGPFAEPLAAATGPGEC